MPQPLDPVIAPMLEPFAGLAIDSESIDIMRAFPLGISTDLSGEVEQRDVVIDSSTGVSIRIYRSPGATAPQPCVYSIHGGGYIIGSVAMDDARFDRWCPTLGCVGVSVEYRRAPETPYPGPVEDCYAGLQWVHEHADELGVDAGRIGILGVSAGGGLAAALALLARDRGGPPILFQVLDSPMLDDRQITPSSQQDGLVIWSRESNEFGWRSYLGDLYGADDVPAHAAPARASDLSGLPPSFVSVGTVDGFRDEDIDYAVRLNQAGVPTELHVYPGACHGYQLAADSPLARQSGHDTERFIKRMLDR